MLEAFAELLGVDPDAIRKGRLTDEQRDRMEAGLEDLCRQFERLTSDTTK
jgi:hypothetical protein